MSMICRSILLPWLVIDDKHLFEIPFSQSSKWQFLGKPSIVR